MIDSVFRGYAAAAAALIPRFEKLSPAELYAPIADLLPSSPSRIADIGAGTGRDAAWLADQGHGVVAVEPVDELRQAAMALHKSQRIEWLNDRLPHLSELRGHRSRFDRVFLSAVWQHLDDDERRVAMRTLADLTARGGMLIMSLRQGPGASGRPVHEARPEDTIDAAVDAGFELIRQREADSVQSTNRAAGVRWTWLVFGLP